MAAYIRISLCKINENPYRQSFALIFILINLQNNIFVSGKISSRLALKLLMIWKLLRPWKLINPKILDSSEQCCSLICYLMLMIFIENAAFSHTRIVSLCHHERAQESEEEILLPPTERVCVDFTINFDPSTEYHFSLSKEICLFCCFCCCCASPL